MLYAVLIYAVEGLAERLPPAEQEALLAKHREVQRSLTEKGMYRGAMRLMPPSTATVITQRNDQVMLLDGPFAETKEQMVGLYLIDSDTMEAVVEVAKGLPLGVASMEVRPVMWGDDFLSRYNG